MERPAQPLRATRVNAGGAIVCFQEGHPPRPRPAPHSPRRQNGSVTSQPRASGWQPGGGSVMATAPPSRPRACPASVGARLLAQGSSSPAPVKTAALRPSAVAALKPARRHERRQRKTTPETLSAVPRPRQHRQRNTREPAQTEEDSRARDAVGGAAASPAQEAEDSDRDVAAAAAASQRQEADDNDRNVASQRQEADDNDRNIVGAAAAQRLIGQRLGRCLWPALVFARQLARLLHTPATCEAAPPVARRACSGLRCNEGASSHTISGCARAPIRNNNPRGAPCW